MNRAFKGIWIPKEIWLDKELSWIEKFLLVEIESLDNEQGCWASNDYFASFFGVSKDRVSKLISGLNRKGYITVELIYKKGTKAVEKRVVKITDRYRSKQLEGIGENTYTPIGENAEDNNTSFNNTINNTKDILSDKSDVVPYLEIIDYLNLKAEKKFKCVAGHKKYIKARWNEGYRLDDFKRVIEIKSKEWLNTPAVKYLQPSTLFGTKFDQYLNQKDTNPIGFNNNYSKKTVRKEVLPDWATDDYDYKVVEAKKAREMAEFNEKLSAIDFDDDLPF